MHSFHFQGKDPDKSELIRENQTLKKKMSNLENTNLVLRDKLGDLEELYACLKEKLETAPIVNEIALKLKEAQWTIRKKNSEIQVHLSSNSSVSFKVTGNTLPGKGTASKILKKKLVLILNYKPFILI